MRQPDSESEATGSPKAINRRNALKTIGAAGTAGVIGVASGIAAIGTAAANNTDEIRVFSNSNHWEYQIITSTSSNDIEKGGQAGGNDSIIGLGDIADGQVNDGGIDNYWMDSDDTITDIKVTYNDYGYLKIDVASPTSFYNVLGVRRDQNPSWPGYGYTIDINGDVKPQDRYFDPGQDSISSNGDNGTFKGTVDPKDTDGVLRTGPPTRIFIEDPDSPGLGLTMSL